VCNFAQREVILQRSVVAAHGSPHRDVNMQCAIVNGSIVIAGHKTSVSLDEKFCNTLKDERAMG